MSRFSRLIDQFEDLEQQDLKNTAQVFAIAADLYQKLEQFVGSTETPGKQLQAPKEITQDFLQKRYGSYATAYQVYKEAYGIKCRSGWKNLLPLIQDLPVPETLEEKVAHLEHRVDVLTQVLLSMTTH